MTQENRTALTRRRVLVAGAAAAGAATLKGTAALAAAEAVAPSVSWSPRMLSDGQAALLSRLCDLLLPRTTTPGAIDAGVPEWIDLAISLAEPSEQLEFLGGLGWIERRAATLHGNGFLELTETEQLALLHEVSDENEPADELSAGAEFFSDLKRQALFAFFTSEKGRVEVLGRPAKVKRQKFRGCRHRKGEHSA